MITVEVMTKNPYFYLKDANLCSKGKKADMNKCGLAEKGTEAYNVQYRYFKRCFLARHSTIEHLQFRIFDDNCRCDIGHQIVRHTKGHPRFVMQSGRPDWNNGAKRKPSDEDWRFFLSTWNPLAFMDAMQQRLCMCAQKETRHWAQLVLDVMLASEDPMLEALADCCMPECEYRGGRCYSLTPCGRCPAVNI